MNKKKYTEMLQNPRWMIVGIFLCLIGLMLWYVIAHDRAYTNDAYVHGNQVYITALHPGFVTKIATDDSFWVKKGQLLIQLNETDARIALKRAKKELANTVRTLCQAFHKVFVLYAMIDNKKAQLLKAQQDLKHRKDVIAVSGVSLENYQHAVDDFSAAKADLNAVIHEYQQSLAFVQGSSISNHPAVQTAAQSVRDAWVKLYRCKIYSPVDGLVAQRTIQVGMWVKPNDLLMSVIPLDQIWVNANFKETQMKRMRIGQLVTLRSDLYGANTVFHGKIVGLPGGAGNAFSLLPPENLSGNWIKIVQRLPVRIELDKQEIKQHPLRIGLSMEVIAKLHDQTGLLVPTSAKGSPKYVTDIFTQEEKGNQQLIKKIIAKNLDPDLLAYSELPLKMPSLSVQKALL